MQPAKGERRDNSFGEVTNLTPPGNRSKGNETALYRDRHGVSPIVRAQFGHRVFNMHFYGFLADRQCLGDGPIAVAFRDQGQYLYLTGA